MRDPEVDGDGPCTPESGRDLSSVSGVEMTTRLSIDSAIIGDRDHRREDSCSFGDESPIDPFGPRPLQVPASQTTTVVQTASMTAVTSNLAQGTIRNSSRRTLRRRKSVEYLSESSSSRPSTVVTVLQHGHVNVSARTSARTSARSGEDSPIDPFYLDNLHVHPRSLSPRTLEVPRVFGEGRSPVSSRQSFDMSYYLDDAGDTSIGPAIPNPNLPPVISTPVAKTRRLKGGIPPFMHTCPTRILSRKLRGCSMRESKSTQALSSPGGLLVNSVPRAIRAEVPVRLTQISKTSPSIQKKHQRRRD
jgi:hypothetical protein